MSSKKTGNRKNAREVAFQMVYQMDVGSNPLDIAVATLEDALAEKKIREIDKDYIMAVVKGVDETQAESDAFISENAKDWTLDRINTVEKNIIRLALYEIRHMDQIPYEVSLNEAVELAKKYGDGGAFAFVNAVLDNARPEGKKAENGEKK